MVRSSQEEASLHWSWLKLVYGHKAHPHEEVFGPELAPLAKRTRVLAEHAVKHWPYWYCEEFADDYEVIKAADRSREWPGTAGMAAYKMMLRVPSTPPSWQLEMVVDELLDKAIHPKERGAGRDEKLLDEVSGQAEVMLAAASRSYESACQEIASAKRGETLSNRYGRKVS